MLRSHLIMTRFKTLQVCFSFPFTKRGNGRRSGGDGIISTKVGERSGQRKKKVRELTFQLNKGKLIDSASQRFVIQSEIEQREPSNFLHPLGAAPRAGGGRRADREHAAYLKEGSAVVLLQRLDAECEESGGRLQVGRASGHLVPQRAHPRLPGLARGLDQPRFPRLQKTHQIRHPVLHLLLQGDALLLPTDARDVLHIIVSTDSYSLR